MGIKVYFELHDMYLSCCDLHPERQDQLPVPLQQSTRVVLRRVLHPGGLPLRCQPPHIRRVQPELQKVLKMPIRRGSNSLFLLIIVL